MVPNCGVFLIITLTCEIYPPQTRQTIRYQSEIVTRIGISLESLKTSRLLIKLRKDKGHFTAKPDEKEQQAENWSTTVT